MTASMDSPDEQEFRVEWWSNSLVSLRISARSAAEAIEKAKSVPLADDGWEVNGMTNVVFAFRADSAPTVLPISIPDGTEHAEDRSYIVSHDLRTTYSQKVRASDFNAACDKARRNDEGWNLVSNWEDWAADLMPE